MEKRSYLTDSEFDALVDAASKTKYGQRDAFMIKFAMRHGLRAKELLQVKWSQINLEARSFDVKRSKKGIDTTHRLTEEEVQQLRALPKHHLWVFTSRRGDKFSYFTFRKMIEAAGVRAGLGVHVHAHMLRHTCGYRMANKRTEDGRKIELQERQMYLGHRNIQHTLVYSRMDASMFDTINQVM